MTDVDEAIVNRLQNRGDVDPLDFLAQCIAAQEVQCRLNHDLHFVEIILDRLTQLIWNPGLSLGKLRCKHFRLLAPAGKAEPPAGLERNRRRDADRARQIGADQEADTQALAGAAEPRGGVDRIAEENDFLLAVAAFAGNHRPTVEPGAKHRDDAEEGAVLLGAGMELSSNSG